MIQFEKLTDVNLIKDYVNLTDGMLCDISLGVRFMWRDEYRVEYAVVDQTLILKESTDEEQDCFYFPIGKNPTLALEAIEEFCVETSLPLCFGCLTAEQAELLQARYLLCEREDLEDWCDYIYTAEQFKTYAGKKLSGQRNHVNKFKKLYPNYKFNIIDEQSIALVLEFLDEFKRVSGSISEEKEHELCGARDLVQNMFSVDQFGGYITVDGKIVALSVGEIVGQTLIVHIEKALKSYEGAYPTMAQEFARAFASDAVKFVNREEDCGDLGLRTSKTQYRPIKLREKIIVRASTLFDSIIPPIEIKTPRLIITDITRDDSQDYFALYTDDNLNKWWGYDYREDLVGSPTPEYFFEFQAHLKAKKEEYALAVKENGRLIGELVLHHFDYFGGVEIGFRFFKEYQGKGYATESANAVIEYVQSTLKAKMIKSRCFKENVKSRALIERLGLKKVDEDLTHYYFSIN